MPIYPARELPIPGVESAMIAALTKKQVIMLMLDQVAEWVASDRPSLLITAGAGNIDTLIDPIKKELEEQSC